MRREFTEAEDIQIRRMASEGQTTGQIAKARGRHIDSIGNRMRRYGIVKVTAKAPPRKWTPEMEAIVRRYLHSETREQIGKRLGVSKASVISFVKRMDMIGLSPHVPKPWTEDEDTFLRDNVGSMSQADMGRELGRDSSSVSRRLDKLNIKIVRLVTTYVAPKAVKPSQVIPLTARPWLTRTSRECKYLYGQRHAYLACCAPVWGDTGHCESHAALCGGYKKVMAA